jgi:hypothetical protein
MANTARETPMGKSIVNAGLSGLGGAALGEPGGRKTRANTARDIHMGRGIVGAGIGGLGGAALGEFGGNKAELADSRRIARKLNQDGALKKVVRGAGTVKTKAGLGLAKGIRGAGIGMGALGITAALPTLLLGVYSPMVLPTTAALVSLAGVPLAFGGAHTFMAGEAMKEKILRAQTLRKAKFVGRGRLAGLAAGAMAGAALLSRGKKAPLEKKSSAQLGNAFMAGFVDELTDIVVG